MRTVRHALFCCYASLVMLAAAMEAHAAVNPLKWLKRKHDPTLLQCASKDGARAHCDADTSAGVTLETQDSKASCERGISWDVDATGIWVDTGCRASFRLGQPTKKASTPRENSAPARTPATGLIICSSTDNRWEHCAADMTLPITLRRQLSADACIRSQTWGTDANGIWVSGGCRAEFQVGMPEAVAVGQGKLVRCDSIGGVRQQCEVATGRGVALVKQRSNLRCTLGQTWGFDDDAIWVTRGCRADFLVDVASLRGSTVRCESQQGKEAVCLVPAGARVRLGEQRSSTPCVEGRNWQVKADGLHVSLGCRADFVIE